MEEKGRRRMRSLGREDEDVKERKSEKEVKEGRGGRDER